MNTILELVEALDDVPLDHQVQIQGTPIRQYFINAADFAEFEQKGRLRKVRFTLNDLQDSVKNYLTKTVWNGRDFYRTVKRLAGMMNPVDWKGLEYKEVYAQHYSQASTVSGVYECAGAECKVNAKHYVTCLIFHNYLSEIHTSIDHMKSEK